MKTIIVAALLGLSLAGSAVVPANADSLTIYGIFGDR